MDYTIIKVFVLSLILTGVGCAQTTWKTIGNEDAVITLPAGSVIRFGSSASVYATDVGTIKAGTPSPEAWSKTITLTKDTTFTANAAFFGGDPIYGVKKVVQEQVINTPEPTKELQFNWPNTPEACYTLDGSYIDQKGENQTYTATICLHPKQL